MVKNFKNVEKIVMVKNIFMNGENSKNNEKVVKWGKSWKIEYYSKYIRKMVKSREKVRKYGNVNKVD